MKSFKWLVASVLTLVLGSTADAGLFRRKCCCCPVTVVQMAPVQALPPKAALPMPKPIPKPIPKEAPKKETPKTVPQVKPKVTESSGSVTVVVNQNVSGRFGANFVGRPFSRILRGGQCGLFGCR